MSISLLDAAKQVMGSSGIDVPTGVVAASDKTMFYVACETVRKLRRHVWQKTVKSATITMTTATDYALASDFMFYVPDTAWSGGGGRPVNLPSTPTEWTILKSGIGLNPGQFNCRFINDRLEVQNPVSGETIRYEYASKNLLTSSGGTAKEMWTADTDLWVLDDELFLGELKWRWKKEKGIEDWQADKQIADQYQRQMRGQDRGAQTITPCPPGMSWRPPAYFNRWV